MPTPPTDRSRRRRRLLKWTVLGIMGFGITLIAGLPWLLASSSGQRFLLKKANEALSPGGIRFTRFAPSWFGPVDIANFVLLDPQGEPVVKADRVVWDRPLGRILFDRPRFGTLTLLGAQLDIERAPDGSVDLHEALRPILKPNPQFALTIKIEKAAFQFRTTGLAEPIRAEAADITLKVPPAPDAITWNVDLKRQQGGLATRRLEVEGSLDRWRVPPGQLPDLDLSIRGQRWPIDLNIADLLCSSKYDGITQNPMPRH